MITDSRRLPWSAQHLDQPFRGDLTELVESVAGLNAQSLRGPVVGVRARMGDCDLAALDDLRQSYALVKINVMRGTVHLLTARQYWSWRSALQPTLKRIVAGFCTGLWNRVDYEDLLAWGTDFAADHKAVTRGDLGAAAAQRFHTANQGHLGFALRMMLPLVELAPRSSWQKERTRYTLATNVMAGQPAGVEEGLADLARSFATAFGSASVDDFAYWSGLSKSDAKQQSTTLSEALAQRPPAAHDPPAVAVLPEFDNLYFCRRTSDEPLYEAKKDPRFPPARMPGSLVDRGRVVGHWTATVKDAPTLVLWVPRLSRDADREWRGFAAWYARVPSRD